MGVTSPYTSSLMNTTDEGNQIEELGEDMHEMRMVEWVGVDIEEPDGSEPDVPEVMHLTAEPTAQPVRDRRCNFEPFPSVANLTIQYPASTASTILGIPTTDDLNPPEVGLRRRMNNELNFPPNFERLVLGCIDADCCK